MSEQINVKEFPHTYLLKKYNLNSNELSSHTKQLLTDFNRVIRLVASKSADGNVKLTPATQNKLETYDRYICEGIFEYLEDAEKLTDSQSTKEEEQMEEKREEVADKMEKLHEEALEENKQKTETAPPVEKEQEEEVEAAPKKKSGLGFWDFN
jgi:hypothetical protein